MGWGVVTPCAAQTDSTITFAVLDRLLHHAESVLIEGSSYRMKDRIESRQPPPPFSEITATVVVTLPDPPSDFKIIGFIRL